MTKFGMYGKVIANPGQRDLLVEQLLTAARLLENTPGCRLYIINTSPTEPDAVWVTEVWDSEEDHRASLQMESVQALIRETMPIIAGVSDQILVIPVGGKGLPG